MTRLKCAIVSAVAGGFLAWAAVPAQAGVIETSFTEFLSPSGSNTPTDFTLQSGSKTARFTGGEALTLGLPDFYNSPPAAWRIDGAGAGGFGPGVGLIEFGRLAVSAQLFALNTGNGQATINSLDTLGAVLESFTVVNTDLVGDDFSGPGFQLIQFTTPGIASIQIVNSGPADPPNPPYTTFIDSFSAEIPAPGTLFLLGAGLIGVGFARRRHG